MIKIIEKEQDAGVADRRIQGLPEPDKFRSNSRRLAARHDEPAYPKGIIGIATSTLGTPVEIEFQRAVTHAHQHGVPFVWVDDPDGLFPPSERPSFRIKPNP